MFGGRAEGGDVGAHPESRVGGAGVRGDQDVCSLSNAESYHVGGVRFLRVHKYQEQEIRLCGYLQLQRSHSQ